MFVSEETEECFGIWPLIDDSDLNEYDEIDFSMSQM